MNILDKIVTQVKIRVEEQKIEMPLSQFHKTAVSIQKPNKFISAIKKPGIQIIAEIKKASPSLGLIDEDFNPVKIAIEYQSANVAAISVLTEQDFFKGSLGIFKKVRNCVAMPLLRKDFIVDLYQIYQSYYHGAHCILLIASILSKQQLKYFSLMAKELGLNFIVEVHNESELEKALAIDAEIIGINNRNLTTFKVDIETSFRLKEKISSDKVTVSESGINNQTQVMELEDAGFDAILIGETLMRSTNKKEKIKLLLEGNN